MKAVLIVVGIAGVLFCGMHALSVMGTLMMGIDGQYGPTKLLAHVVGVAIGLLVAVVCFGKCKRRPSHAEEN